MSPAGIDHPLRHLTKILTSTINTTAGVSPRLAGKLAFELWRHPLARSKVRAAERGIHRAARTSRLGGVVTYEWGDGRRPVLLVHGWRSRASRYAALVARLTEHGFSPISYDAPGHGDSAGRAATILEHQQIIRTLADRHGPFEAVVAHSLGVPFALYAVRQGVAAKRVVTVGGVAEFEYLVDGFCKALQLGPSVNRALRRSIEQALFDGDTAIWDKFSALHPADAELLVVHDDEDEVVAPAQAELLASAYGHRAQRFETSGLGHHRILSDAAVIDETVRFIDAARSTGRGPGTANVTVT